MSTKSFSDELKLNATTDTNAGSLSFYANVLTKISNPYFIALAYTDSGNSRYDLELFNRTIDICMLLQNRRYEPLLQIVLKMLKNQSGNFIPRKCPINKVELEFFIKFFVIEDFLFKKLYSMKDAVINSEIFPPEMPEKKAFIKLTFQTKDDYFLKDLGMFSGYIRIEKFRRSKM